MPNLELREKLLAFYESLLSRAEGGEVFLRLGRGKTYMDNSLALVLSNLSEREDKKREDTFVQFRELFQDVDPTQALYPITRTLTLPDGLPMGWVRVKEMHP